MSEDLKHIGDYDVISVLGDGGMGRVYLAEQKSMRRLTALKVLLPEMSENQEYLGRFFHEVRTLAQIEHPGVVRAIEAGVENGVCFFSMMYTRGKDVRKHIEAGVVFGELSALKIIVQTAAALDSVWRLHKIIHRDVKPANIMLTPEGEAKLLDLGISKTMTEDLSLTTAGMMVGTPTYVSPEQARADKNIDFKADMYSLGASYYHMITGHPPFEADTNIGVITRHLSEPVPDPRKANGKISGRSFELIKKMMAKRPEERFPSWADAIRVMNSIITELEDAAAPAPAPAAKPEPPAAPPPAPKRSPLKNPGVIRTACLLAVLLLFIMAFISVVRRSLREAERGRASAAVAEAAGFARNCPDGQTARAVAMLEDAQRAAARAGVDSSAVTAAMADLQKKALEEKQKRDAERAVSALDSLRRKSAELEDAGSDGEALKLWSWHLENSELRGVPEFQKEVSRQTERLKEKINQKKKGLADE